LLSPFPTPFFLIDFFHKQAGDYVTRDSILSCLINEYQGCDLYHLLGAFFPVLFTPAIVRIYSRIKRASLNMNSDEVLNQICLFLLETLKSKEIAEVEEKVASRIIGRVKNLMRSWINQKLKDEEKCVELSEEKDYHPLPVIEKPGLPDLEEAESFLNLLVKAGVITETDKLIILGSKIAKRPLREIAGGPENYQRIKKRRQRAIHAMEQYLERKRRRYATKAGLEKDEVSLAEILKGILGRDIH